MPLEIPTNRVVLMHNPEATHGKDVDVFAGHMLELGYKPWLVPTSPDITETSHIMRTEVEEGDLVAAFGGDGTFHIVAFAALEAGLENTLTHIAKGKGNDNGRSQHRMQPFRHVLEHGIVAAVHPLDLLVEQPHAVQSTVHKAIGYASLHGAVRAARGLHPLKAARRARAERGEKPQHSLAELQEDAMTSLHAVTNQTPITAYAEDGRELKLADATWCNIDSFAKFGKPRINPFVRAHQRLLTSEGGKFVIGARMSLLAMGLLPGEYFEGQSRLTVFGPGNDPIDLQLDGEFETPDGRALQVASGSTVCVGSSVQSVKVLTTRHRMVRKAGRGH